MALPRPCLRCSERFQPNGKHNKICPKCCEKSKMIRLEKQTERLILIKLKNTSNSLNKAL